MNKIDEQDSCAICLSEPILPIQLSNCNHTFCFLCIKAVGLTQHYNFVCPLCRTKIENKDISNAHMDIDKLVEVLNDSEVWLYQTKDGRGSWIFDYETNKSLINVISLNNTTFECCIGTRKYTIDLINMLQIDSKTFRKRKILHIMKFNKDSIVQYKIRGIAGVYFNKSKDKSIEDKSTEDKST